MNCEMLAKTRKLAIQKGLDEDKIQCPFYSVCKGQRCYMFDAVEGFEENLTVAESLKKWEEKTNLK